MVNILYCSATPDTEESLDIDQEVREITAAISPSARREFHIEIVGAIRLADLPRQLLGKSIDIFHFSGHGSSRKELIFEDEKGNAHPVNNESIRLIFETLGDGIKCVVLNSCFSHSQAREISQYVPYVIGNTKKIQDKHSIQFSAEFYHSLSYGKTIPEAFKIAKAVIASYHKNGNDIAIIHKKIKFQLSNPLVFHHPVILAKFDSEDHPKADSRKRYKMIFWIEFCPKSIVSIDYNISYRGKDYSDEVINDGTGLEYKAAFYGNLPLKVTLWFREDGVGLVSTIYDALEKYYTRYYKKKTFNSLLSKAMKQIREY